MFVFEETGAEAITIQVEKLSFEICTEPLHFESEVLVVTVEGVKAWSKVMATVEVRAIPVALFAGVTLEIVTPV